MKTRTYPALCALAAGLIACSTTGTPRLPPTSHARSSARLPVQLGHTPASGRLCTLGGDCLRLAPHPPHLCALGPDRCSSTGRFAQIAVP